MLKTQDLATVVNKLQVPVIVSDILRDEGALTDDVHYGLHETISDMQPDSALLCIALSVKKIANMHGKDSASLRVLEIECGRIIEDYAGLWLKNAENKHVDESEALDVLCTAAEDLEGIAEMLEINAGFLKEQDKNAATLAEIMIVQAKAHALIAEAYFEAIEEACETAASNTVQLALAQRSLPSNVVLFPQKRGA